MATTKTFRQAREDLIRALASGGWEVRSGLKVPTAEKGLIKLFFLAQSVHYSVRGGPARSMWLDIRRMQPDQVISRLVEFEEAKHEVAVRAARWSQP